MRRDVPRVPSAMVVGMRGGHRLPCCATAMYRRRQARAWSFAARGAQRLLAASRNACRLPPKHCNEPGSPDSLIDVLLWTARISNVYLLSLIHLVSLVPEGSARVEGWDEYHGSGQEDGKDISPVHGWPMR